MEKEGVVPDVFVEPDPDRLARGQDLQLARAVEVLQHDVLAWKKSGGSIALVPGANKAVAPPTPAAPVGR
jgi:hypothetical protein